LSKFALTLCAAALSLLSATTAHSDDRDVPVKFKPGATSATFTDQIKGYDVVNYYIDALAGQIISVQFEKNKNSCYFNVLSVATGKDLANDSAAASPFASKLVDSGRYRIVVYIMRASARRKASCKFSIILEVKG